MSVEFHIYASDRDPCISLQMPGEHRRIEFLTISEAARHARQHPDGKGGTAVIHDDDLSRVNRIPL